MRTISIKKTFIFILIIIALVVQIIIIVPFAIFGTYFYHNIKSVKTENDWKKSVEQIVKNSPMYSLDDIDTDDNILPPVVNILVDEFDFYSEPDVYTEILKKDIVDKIIDLSKDNVRSVKINIRNMDKADMFYLELLIYENKGSNTSYHQYPAMKVEIFRDGMKPEYLKIFADNIIQIEKDSVLGKWELESEETKKTFSHLGETVE